MCGFYSFSPFPPLISFIFDVFGVIQNHQIIPSPNYISPSGTLISASANRLSSLLITLLCGWVSSFLPFLPLLPFLVKERMRLEREEATRQLEEETEVRHFSQGGLLATFLSIWVTKHSSNFFLLSHYSNLSSWKLISPAYSCYYTILCQFPSFLI